VLKATWLWGDAARDSTAGAGKAPSSAAYTGPAGEAASVPGHTKGENPDGPRDGGRSQPAVIAEQHQQQQEGEHGSVMSEGEAAAMGVAGTSEGGAEEETELTAGSGDTGEPSSTASVPVVPESRAAEGSPTGAAPSDGNGSAGSGRGEEHGGEDVGANRVPVDDTAEIDWSPSMMIATAASLCAHQHEQPPSH